MLAMMFIVTLVAGSIFAVTRDKLEAAWREIIETRFQSQTESLANMQKARLDSIQERCRELAADPKVFEALESGTAELPEEIQKDLLGRARVVQASASSFDAQTNRPGPSPPVTPGGIERFPGRMDGNFQRPSTTQVPWRPQDEETGAGGARRFGSESGAGRRRGFRQYGNNRQEAGLYSPDSGIAWLSSSGRVVPASSDPALPGAVAATADGKNDPKSATAAVTASGSAAAAAPSNKPATAGSQSEGGAGGGARNLHPASQDLRRRFPWGPPTFLNMALMDAEGHIRTLRSGPESEAQTEWLEKNKVKQVPTSQEVAYMAIKPEGNPYSSTSPVKREGQAAPPFIPLREVILTPIRKAASEAPIGALIVGLPVSTYGESALYDLKRQDKPGEMFTGLWIDDQLFSQTIPQAVRDSVSGIVRNNISTPGSEGDLSTITIDSRPYQILFRSLNASPSTPPAYQITLFSLAGLVDEKNEVRAKVLWFSAIAFGAAMLLSWLLSRRLVHPVQALVEGAHKIKNGLYDTRVAITTQDELATLAVAFNEMAEGLRQRERYRDILFQVSDDDIARQLIETACLGGERREISVLFCDIRSFTATTSGMAPEGIIDMLNEHMTALTDIVHRHHGVVDKFVGDLIMAIFGAPKSYGDDAGNAAACALEMVARREELNQTTAHPPLLMGIGVASGTVVAGCMGSENRLNYTVLGEPVNLASRLCSAAGPREVIVDPHTLSLLGARAAGHLLRPLLLKGFPDPVQPFHLTRLVETKAATASLPAGQAGKNPV